MDPGLCYLGHIHPQFEWPKMWFFWVRKGFKKWRPPPLLTLCASLESLSRILYITRNHLILGSIVIVRANSLPCGPSWWFDCFYKADWASLRHLMHTFHPFSGCSSLIANCVKSQIVFDGCDSQSQQDYLHITSLNEGSLPSRYLGCLLLQVDQGKLNAEKL